MSIRRSARFLLPVSLSLLAAACGGGGGGGGGGGSSSSSGTSSQGSNPTVVTAPDNSSRQINADCSFSQNLGAARNDGLRIQNVEWLQSVGLDAGDADTRMIAGKAIKVRVDVLANAAMTTPSRHEIMVYDPSGGGCTTIPLTAPSSVPTSVDAYTLNTAFVATIPASLVKPGMSVSMIIDDASGRTAGEADQTWRVYDPAVAAAVTETVRIIPISFGGSTGYVSDPAALASVITRMYPVTNVNVVVASPFAPASLSNVVSGLLGLLGATSVGSYSLMQTVLDQVDDRCALLNGSQSSARTAPKCIGLFPDNLIFKNDLNASGTIVGLAYVGGVTMIAQSVSTTDISVSGPYASSHWLSGRALTVAHEYGHLLDLDHANCGGATGLDPRLYSDGRLGSGAGYDVVRDAFFSATRLASNGQPMFADTMSYCGKEWTSDRGYLAALAYRAGSAYVAARETESAGKWLKVSQVNGEWKIRQADFAPATLKSSGLSMEVSSDLGSEEMELVSATVSDAQDAGAAVSGPYYLKLGDRKAQGLRLLKSGKELKRWNANAIAAGL